MRIDRISSCFIFIIRTFAPQKQVCKMRSQKWNNYGEIRRRANKFRSVPEPQMTRECVWHQRVRLCGEARS